MIINYHLRLKISSLFCLLVVPLLLSVTPSFVWGQLPVNPLNAEQVETLPPEAGTTAQQLVGLRQHLSKARQSLNSAKSALEMTLPAQIGATTEEIKEKLFLLFARVFFYSNHIESLRWLEETRRASEDLAAKSEAWHGFEQQSPYPISLVDGLRDDINVQLLTVTKAEIRRKLLEQELREARKVLISSAKELRQNEEALERSLSKRGEIRSNWVYELALLKNEVAERKVLSNRAQLQAIDESLSLAKKQKIFLERQLLVAAPDAIFSQKEYEQQIAPLSKKLKTLDKEKIQLTRDNLRNQEKLDQARAALRQAREGLTEKGSASELKLKTDYLQQVVETRKVQADTSAQLVELQRIWALAINGEIFLWGERYRLANRSDDVELKPASTSLKERYGTIFENKKYIESNLKLTQHLVLNAEQRLTAGQLTNEAISLVKQGLATYRQKVVFIDQLLTAIDDLARNTQRFQDELDYFRQKASFGSRLKGVLVRNLGTVGDIWHYELFVVEDTISINGQPVTAQRPVTISKVVRALLILGVGLWGTSLLKSRVSLLIVKVFKSDTNSAFLVEKFFLYTSNFILLLIALIMVKIPLTAFAFMGGALAIGVGLGAQALINNFISGIILLFEKPIKPEDMVEVEGVRGRVVRIGLRCSQVKRFDGVDILVPNSEFLQKNVINWTHSDELIRMQVKIGVAYGSPTREVSRIISNALKEHGRVLKAPEPMVLFEDFGDSALIFSAYFWVEITSGLDTRVISSDLRHMLGRRLDEANITIAFPQLDVHLDKSNSNSYKQMKSRWRGRKRNTH